MNDKIPETSHTGIREEVQRFIERGKIQAEHWDEDKTLFKPLLYLHADTYNVEPLFEVPSSHASAPLYTLSPRKQFAYCNRIVPAGLQLRNCGLSNQKGLVCWDGEIAIPSLIDMRREAGTGATMPECTPEKQRVEHGAVWMSLTPNEMLSQRSGIQRASGKVLIGGLGLGWFVPE